MLIKSSQIFFKYPSLLVIDFEKTISFKCESDGVLPINLLTLSKPSNILSASIEILFTDLFSVSLSSEPEFCGSVFSPVVSGFVN